MSILFMVAIAALAGMILIAAGVAEEYKPVTIIGSILLAASFLFIGMALFGLSRFQ